MNRFKCVRCGRNQYTACNTAEGCIYCGNKELKKMEILEQETEEKKIRIATVDKCVMCGGIIPEGQQVCGLCKHKIEETINCRYYAPACARSKTSGSQKAVKSRTSKARVRKDDANLYRNRIDNPRNCGNL